MAYNWSSDLEIGYEDIDNQHKQLVETYNKVLNACVSEDGYEEIKEVLNFLCEYTVKHFADEEDLQIQLNYPGYNEHKALHDAFKVKATELVKQFETDGFSLDFVLLLETEVGEWLINHIKNQDAKISSNDCNYIDELSE